MLLEHLIDPLQNGVMFKLYEEACRIQSTFVQDYCSFKQFRPANPGYILRTLNLYSFDELFHSVADPIRSPSKTFCPKFINGTASLLQHWKIHQENALVIVLDHNEVLLMILFELRNGNIENTQHGKIVRLGDSNKTCV